MTDNAETPSEKKNKGGRPRTDFTKTPEFKEAVDAAVNSALPAILTALGNARAASDGAAAAPLPAAVGGDTDWAERLAVALATLTNQGNVIKKLEPAEVKRREEGQSRLIHLLATAHAGRVEAPHYRVIAKVYLTDFVVEPFRSNPRSKEIEPVTIDWTGIPNEALLPLNDTARDIFEAFMQTIGGPTPLNSNIDTRNVAVTPKGLVVRGLNASAHRDVGSLPDGSGTDLMGVRTPNDPRSKSVNVLGTVAAAAQAVGPDAAVQKFAGELRI